MRIKRTHELRPFSQGYMLAFLVLLLLGVRLVAWWNTALISRDSVIYLELAKSWFSGRYAQAAGHPYHPLYPFLIALVSKIFGLSLEHAAVGLSLGASALTLLALARLYREYTSPRVLFLGLFFFCISPFLVRYASDVLSEPLYLFFVAWAAAFFIRASVFEKELIQMALFLLAGMCVGFAYLTRPEGLIVGVTGVIWFFVFHRNLFLKRKLASLLVFVVGGVIVGGPYVLYLHRSSGEWLLTRKKRIGTLITEMSGKTVSRPLPKPGMMEPPPKGVSKKRAEFLRNRRKWQWEQADRIRQAIGEPIHPRVPSEGHIGRFLLVFLESLGEVGIGFVKGMFFPIGIWVVFRFFCFTRYPFNRIDGFFLIFSVLYWLMLAALLSGYGYVSRRHYSAVAMFWFAWAAIGFIRACEIFASSFRKRSLRVKTVGAFLLVPIVGTSVIKGTKPYRLEKAGRKAVGTWILREKADKRDCTILTSMVRVGYYARCRSISLQTIQERDVNALRRHEITFVVLQRREIEAAPALMKLLGMYGYREVYRYVSPIGHQELHVFTYRR